MVSHIVIITTIVMMIIPGSLLGSTTSVGSISSEITSLTSRGEMDLALQDQST